MFKAAPNPYDEIVAKATDDHQTSENWEVIISLCDKVIDEGESGARNVVAAILKRLAHRTSNVQLYALSLAEALEKNCTIDFHRELASKSFTQGIEKLITDRNTHAKVRKRALVLVKQWADSFEPDATLGIMNECYENLRTKGYKFEGVVESPPIEVDDAIRRQEEEELQRVLEMSKTDKGGRSHWVDHSSVGAGSSSAATLSISSGAGSSGGPSGKYPSGYTPSASPALSTQAQPPSRANPMNASGGPAGATQSTVAPEAATVVQRRPTQRASVPPSAQIAAASPAPATEATSTAAAVSTVIPTPAQPPVPKPASRVRALHKFEPTEPGELGFEKGDVIKVVDRGYKDWWRGQLRGKTGIFPVNYVEPIPEPTQEEIIREAQAEAQIFAQAAAIDQLLEMLKKVDPLKDNLADNEEIQELYRSSMTLRPKIVKLIDRYSQKRADLLAMNESFVKARKVYDQVMEESLAKYNPGASLQDYTPRFAGPAPGQTQYGWNPVAYNGPYGPQQGQAPVSGQYTQPQPQFEPPSHYPSQDPAQQYANPFGTPGGQDPAASFQTHGSQYTSTPNPYGPSPAQSQAPQPQPGYGQTQQFQQQQPTQPQAQSPPLSAQPSYSSAVRPATYGRPGTAGGDVQVQTPAWDQAGPQQSHAHPMQLPADPQQSAGSPRQQSLPQGGPHQPSFNATTAAPTSSAIPGLAYAAKQSHQQPSINLQDPSREVSPPIQQQSPVIGYAQPLNSYQPAAPASQLQQHVEQEPAHAPPQHQTTSQPETSSAPPESSIISGPPPYPWDPNKKYADPGADAWAQYYAKGGPDPAGRVYFILSTLPASARLPADASPPSIQPVSAAVDKNEFSQQQPKATSGSPQRETSPIVSTVTGSIHRHSSYSATSSRPQSFAISNLTRKSSQPQSLPGSAGGAPPSVVQYSPTSTAQASAQQLQSSYGEPNYAGRMRPSSTIQSAQHPPFAQYMQPGAPEPGHTGTDKTVGAPSLNGGQRREGEGLV